ncbi:methyltransferase [Alcanivorax sp. 1008]|uniref:class I SAM-dependent methyltransferase n=1 Tax=Alcanivorax sp. 1008 TaxID=2816853 RepID=UPI001DCA0FA1|nr:class I SAM-dependent methyltransferase [Alcanivorax sp. 1008]MCC1496421.1 class I SAM-dependent methyltransferase [Alcanivorax sp. 1008]
MSSVRIARNDTRAVHSRSIVVLKPSHPLIRKLKRDLPTPCIHGDKVWDSSWLLMDELRRNPPPKKGTLMDLGCGWGPLSVYAAKKLKQQVIAVDADDGVFPYLQLHAQLNGVEIETRQRRFEKLKRSDLDGVHTLAGADICFWDELTPVLFKLIRRSLKAGVERVIIADPGRDPFYQLAERCEKAFNARVVERKTSKPKLALADLLIVEA